MAYDRKIGEPPRSRFPGTPGSWERAAAVESFPPGDFWSLPHMESAHATSANAESNRMFWNSAGIMAGTRLLVRGEEISGTTPCKRLHRGVVGCGQRGRESAAVQVRRGPG